MFSNQPKGLYTLALANTGERFGYYTMIAVFVLFLKSNFGLDPAVAGGIYSAFLMLVYLMPLVGGALADRFGYGKMVTLGIVVMFLGYMALSLPLGGGNEAIASMLGALLLISVGTGLFKGNLQVMVGNLYDDPRYETKRDEAFSIFYMAINIGALFAPTAAVKVMDYAQSQGVSVADSYHYAFAVACASLILSIAIYYFGRSTFRHVESAVKKADGKESQGTQLSAADTRARIVALVLVFAVVIFFWMAFQQNGLTLTFFADEFTARTSSGVLSMTFDVTNLVLLIVIVYAAFALFQGKTRKGRTIAGVIIAGCIAALVWKYHTLAPVTAISAPIFQHFNPCYVVGLTPVSIALFGWLARKGKEPSAPRKIALGMLVAAVAYLVLAIGSVELPSPVEQAQAVKNGTATFASPNWLIITYLIMTFGELLLSPIGLSFVSKVAPPKYKGLMMGGWFVSTAAGNLLVAVGGLLWGSIPLWMVWGVFVVLCLISALFMMAIMKRLEAVC